MLDAALECVGQALDQFPVAGTEREKLCALVRYAILAPSSHNSQPWLFRFSGDSLEVWADRTRSLPVVDPADRELVISCGAALGTLEAALHHFGYEGITTLCPDPRRPDLVARVDLGQERIPLPSENDLFAAIHTRRTNRFAFAAETIDPALLEEFESLAARGGAWFEILQAESRRQALVELITEADAIQMADPSFRRELASWVHPNRSRNADGMPGAVMGLSYLASLAAPLVIRTFDLGDGTAARNRDLALGSPVLAVLGTEGETTEDWVRTGQVLSRILLRAQVGGVAASFLNQPAELPALRLRLSALMGRSGFPQIVLRMGHPRSTAPATPRRPVGEVLMES